MNKSLLSFLFTILIFSCSKGNVNNRNCKFLLNVGVNTTINLSLPQYNSLQFASNSVYEANAGNKGIIIVNAGTGFLAWDAADPNHTPNSCSVLSATGLEATCGCADENQYSLITGQPLSDPNLPCGLKAYRVEQSGSNLIITN